MLHMFSDLRQFQRDPLNFFLQKGVTAKEPLVKMNVGFSPVYLVTDTKLSRQILRADEAEIDKGRLIYKMREVIGRSSLTLSGKVHKERRSAIYEKFVEGLSGHYVPQICSTIREFIAPLSKDGVIEAPGMTAHLAMRVISTILFGHGSLSLGDENAIVDAVHLTEDDLAEEIFRTFPHTPWSYWRKKKKLGEARRIMSLVVQRVKDVAKDQSLISAFKELGLEGEDLRDEILLMFLAGHHTTGTATAWLLYHLAIEDGLSEALAQEAAEIGDATGELTPSKIKTAQVSRGLAQEILRLYPSSYWMSRETKKSIKLGDYDLQKGTSLIISPWHLHRDPKYWRDPEQFDIIRSYKNPAYIPFGYGGRACVGLSIALLELQLVALEFASAFHIEVLSEVPAAAPKPSVTLVPSNIKLRLVPKGVGRPHKVSAMCS